MRTVLIVPAVFLGWASAGPGPVQAQRAAATAAAGPPIAIAHVTVVDVERGQLLRDRQVLVTGARITAVDSGAAARPAGARVVDGRGKFLIPGLWDMHVHLAKAGAPALGLFVANGVTSVRDVGGDFAVVRQWRSEIAAGSRVGPRIRTAGPILESAARVRRMKARGVIEPVERFRAPVADTTDARRVVDSLARLGVDLIKVRTAASPEVYHAVATAARRAGLPLAAHGDVVPLEDMLRAGQRSIEHAIRPPLQQRHAGVRARLVRALADSGVAVVPTMVNYHRWLLVSPAEARRIIEDSAGRLDPRRRYISGYLLADWREQVGERGRVKDALVRRFYLPRLYRGVLRDLREMHRAGVRILPGTDVAVALMYPGFSLHDELGYFVEQIGMTPMEALVSATRRAAEFSGTSDSLGTVEVGKLADLVLLDADPLADVRNTQRIHAVVANGRLLDRAALDALLAAAERPASAPPSPKTPEPYPATGAAPAAQLAAGAQASSADGPYTPGTGTPSRRRYTPSCARWCTMWLSPIERRSCPRGPWRMTWSPARITQRLPTVSHVMPSTAARMAALSASNSASRSVVVSSVRGTYSKVAQSSSSVSSSVRAKRGSSARCVARRPSVIDFSCGCQSALPSGTRSRMRRVVASSAARSPKSSSAGVADVGPDEAVGTAFAIVMSGRRRVNATRGPRRAGGR